MSILFWFLIFKTHLLTGLFFEMGYSTNFPIDIWRKHDLKKFYTCALLSSLNICYYDDKPCCQFLTEPRSLLDTTFHLCSKIHFHAWILEYSHVHTYYIFHVLIIMYKNVAFMTLLNSFSLRKHKSLICSAHILSHMYHPLILVFYSSIYSLKGISASNFLGFYSFLLEFVSFGCIFNVHGGSTLNLLLLLR